MSINFRTGVAYCHACGEGGTIEDLLALRVIGLWIPKEEHPAFAGRR